jgi:glutamyl-Q tRNA(Asp) synthetase
MQVLSSIGRFAPSPTGPLHFGSLVSALASFLDARQRKGKWLVRMEDIDPPREVAGASDQILKQLDSHGLSWDGPVLYQSTRLDSYRAALETLVKSGLVYHCQCNRRRIVSLDGIYDGQCRDLKLPKDGQAARLRVDSSNIYFRDQITGDARQNLHKEVGDFVLQRRDELYSYQLAVVIDDEYQGITHIMRGSDLHDSTARQIYLQRCLGYGQPEYAHLPLALNTDGQKLSKQNLAASLVEGNEASNLWAALDWLQQSPPKELQQQSIDRILQWGIDNWSLNILAQNPEDMLAPEGY